MLIYYYGIICLSMIVVNILYGIYLHHKEARQQDKISQISKEIMKQIRKADEKKMVGKGHTDYLCRKLSRVSNLIAYDHALEILKEKEGEEYFTAYVTQIQPIFLHLALVYLKKEKMQSAYFAVFLSKYKQRKNMPVDSVRDIMLEYLKKDSIYCRLNALEALCKFAEEETIVKAVRWIDEAEIFFHEKLLTEALLSFTGNHDGLIALFWEKMDDFSVKTQLAILNYIRFKSGAYCDNMYRIMRNEEKDKELRFAAIRYFAKYPYEPAKNPLVAFVLDKNPLNWEYAAISASSLAHYEGEIVIEALKGALYSANWYVRYNAALSLEAHQLNYEDLIGIMDGNDRYAREMMIYRLDARRLKEEGGY